MIPHTVPRAIHPRLSGARNAFTLIELLVVMSIILVLAGLVISVVGNVQYKSSFARATSEIKAMETALGSYQVDNGMYPRDSSATNATDSLNARTSFDPGTSAYKNSSMFLYKALTGYNGANTAPGKSYMPFTSGQLSSGAISDTTYIVDPWGASYGYSTIYQKTPDGSVGYNPTFDLWSTAGYPGGGKTYGSLTDANKNTVWAKNW